jgi:hypothetical protein
MRKSAGSIREPNEKGQASAGTVKCRSVITTCLTATARAPYCASVLAGIGLAIGWLLEGIPLIRSVWRRMRERQMEISVVGPIRSAGVPEELEFTLAIEETPEFADFKPSLFTVFTLRLINHRTDRMERISGAYVSIKKRRLLLWRKTLARAPVHLRGSTDLLGPLVTDIPLEPLSAPKQVQCVVQEKFQESLRQQLPQRFELWLELDMVGPVRRVKRKIDDGVRKMAN